MRSVLIAFKFLSGKLSIQKLVCCPTPHIFTWNGSVLPPYHAWTVLAGGGVSCLRLVMKKEEKEKKSRTEKRVGERAGVVCERCKWSTVNQAAPHPPTSAPRLFTSNHSRGTFLIWLKLGTVIIRTRASLRNRCSEPEGSAKGKIQFWTDHAPRVVWLIEAQKSFLDHECVRNSELDKQPWVYNTFLL